MNSTPSMRQQRLAALLQQTTGIIRVDDAMKILQLERDHANKLLAGWHKQGVIRRVAHGVYVPILASATGRIQVLADPWVLAPILYDPAYIGGWSALMHWELTEQLFQSVCVLTAKRVACGEKQHQGVTFFIRSVPKTQLFGMKVIWKDNVKLHISDPYKTVLDIIDDVTLGAGLQHTVDCLMAFQHQYDSASDLARLLDYADCINNGALFKKLGFLAEAIGMPATLVDACSERLTQGYAHLDKTCKDHHLVTKWRLWVPKGFAL